jgi:hypothetical protein
MAVGLRQGEARTAAAAGGKDPFADFFKEGFGGSDGQAESKGGQAGGYCDAGAPLLRLSASARDFGEPVGSFESMVMGGARLRCRFDMGNMFGSLFGDMGNMGGTLSLTHPPAGWTPPSS